MFENFPICTAKFAVDGSELLLGSEYRTYLQSYDMNTGRALHIPCPVSGPEINSMSNFCLSPDGRMLGVSGRDGSVMLMTARSREWVGTVKMSGKCHALTFNSDGSQLLTYGMSGSGSLAPTRLQFSRLTDVTEKVSNKRTIITAVDFHPRTQAVVVTNRPGLATFYQFAVDGSELLLGSEYRTYLQSYDMNTGRALHIPCPVSGPEINSMSNFCLSPDGRMLGVSGRDGSVMLMTARSREWIGTVKMSGKCHALTFNSDGSQLLTYGKEGGVYIWDVGERRCIHRFHDDGCLQGLSLAVSPDDRYVACGSGSGVVNIYTGAAVLPKAANSGLSDSPRPSKAIMNLTTAAHQVIFNSSSQLLATVSRCKDSAVKLVHLPSLTVYSNFPTRDLDIARPEAVAFSPNGGYLAIGNNIGAVRLLRLHHFANY
ncbi:hypothetical protein B566_EDAN015421 [Ephemera danica]|nr:hypothetical protein B566_EDAN015421 [Ephemera danica]